MPGFENQVRRRQRRALRNRAAAVFGLRQEPRNLRLCSPKTADSAGAGRRWQASKVTYQPYQPCCSGRGLHGHTGGDRSPGFFWPGSVSHLLVSKRPREIGSVQADLEFLIQRHLFVPNLLGYSGFSTSSGADIAGQYSSPAGSFVAAAFQVVPAFEAYTSGSSSYTALAKTLRPTLEAELPRLIGYVSAATANTGSLDLCLLISLIEIANFFGATGHCQFVDRVVGASNALVRRVVRKLAGVQNPQEIGGLALLQSLVRATWTNLQMEFINALITGKHREALALVEEASNLHFPEPLHVWTRHELRQRESQPELLPPSVSPEPINLSPLTLGEIVTALFAEEQREAQQAILASHYGLLEHRGPAPLAFAAQYLAILAGSLCDQVTADGFTDNQASISMIDLLTNGQFVHYSSPFSVPSESPIGSSNSSDDPTWESQLASLRLNRSKILLALARIEAALPGPIKLADEAGDLVALARFADAWWYPTEQISMSVLVMGLFCLHLTGIVINSPEIFTDKDLWTSDYREGPKWSSWSAWIDSVEFKEACTHAIILSRYARSFIQAAAAKTVADSGYHIPVVATYPSPITSLCILRAAWVLIISRAILKQNDTMESSDTVDPSHAQLAMELEASARMCLDFVVAAPWKPFHQPAQALQRMLITPLLGPKEEDIAIFKHAIDSNLQ